ncbi:RNB domain-containing ribonuclease [Nonomuraea thailandensis]
MPTIQVPDQIPLKLEDGFERIRRELKLPGGFPRAVLDEAAWVAKVPRLDAEDMTDVPFVTIDPPGSMDLDQAVHLERLRAGYRVWYAIADVGAFLRPGGVLDAEARTRGETVYLPAGKVPLHPPALSEDAASLLPGALRPAVVWRIDLDSDGRTVGADVQRALVRSRERYDYDYVQAVHDTGTADGVLELLAEIGELRLALERERGGVTLPTPDQEVVHDDGGYRLEFRLPLPAEAWNAQISLLTGMAAATMMLDAEIGVLRVLPGPQRGDLAKVRRVAQALDVPWPEEPGTAPSCTGWTRRRGGTRRSCTSRRCCCAGPPTWPSTARRPGWPSTRRSRPRTRTSRPRCGAWSTGTRPRCAWRSRRASRSRPPCGPRSRSYRTSWRLPGGARGRWNGRAWTSWRRSCCAIGSGRRSRRW